MHERIDAAIDARMDEAVTLLSDLVACRSVNPLQPGVDGALYAGGERAAQEVLAAALQGIGAEISWVAVDPARPNLVGILRGSGQGRSLAFNAHIDTVAPQTDDPWTATIEGTRLTGLGSTDMKGGHAAIWLAMAAVRDSGLALDGDVHLHSVVGEETMSHELGTSAVLEAGHRTDAAVIAEPTSPPDSPLHIYNTAPGNYLFSMTVRGKSTHWTSRNLAIRAGGAGDDVGVNALEKAVYIYHALRQLEEQWAFSKRHPAFPPGAFIIHPGVLHADVGFPAAPYFPDRAKLDYLLSFPPGDTGESIRAEVEEHVRTASRLDPWLREHPVEFEWIDTWPPAYTDPGSDFAREAVASRHDLAHDDVSLPDVEGVETGGYQTDASFYEAQGVPALVCGPGTILQAHAAGEWVDLEYVRAAARYYARLVVRWCTRP